MIRQCQDAYHSTRLQVRIGLVPSSSPTTFDSRVKLSQPSLRLLDQLLSAHPRLIITSSIDAIILQQYILLDRQTESASIGPALVFLGMGV